VIDPGQAFGTGAHATTRLCLELMLDRRPAGAFVDLGCGSGVLAIVAAKLGWAPVLALDYDLAAVAATEANARANHAEVQVQRFDLRSGQVPAAELVAANVLAGPLRTWAAVQTQLSQQLILSGLLVPEASGVTAAFAARGLRERERRVLGEWAALYMTLPSG
jgi:ribosomal protein L11 methyltransferase